MAKGKKSGVKIPKQVAGVKVPKQLRKQGNKLIEHAKTPAGREALIAGAAMIGTAIAAGAKANAERRAADQPSPSRAKTARHPGEPGTDPDRNPAAKLGEDLAAKLSPHLNPELNRALATGIGALEAWLGNKKRG